MVISRLCVSLVDVLNNETHRTKLLLLYGLGALVAILLHKSNQTTKTRVCVCPVALCPGCRITCIITCDSLGLHFNAVPLLNLRFPKDIHSKTKNFNDIFKGNTEWLKPKDNQNALPFLRSGQNKRIFSLHTTIARLKCRDNRTDASDNGLQWNAINL